MNAGLALKEMPKEANTLKPNVNVLPIPYLPRHIPLHKLMALPAAACAVALLILMATTIQDAAADISKLQNQLDTSNSLITKKQSQKLDTAATLTSLEKAKTAAEGEYDTYSAALKKLTTSGNTMNLDLDASVENADVGFILVSLSLNGAQVAMTGRAESEEDVFVYIRSLTATGRFKEITISNISLSGEEVAEGDSGVTYSLNCVLKEDR